jgi:hypothetical protein
LIREETYQRGIVSPMKFERDISIEANLLDWNSGGIILEITFIGIHSHFRPHGKKIYDFLEAVVNKHRHDALLLDYLKYRYTFGNELLSTIIIPIFNFKQKSIHPCAIIADGATKNSIQSLLNESMIQKVCNIVVFSDKVRALEHIKRELSTAESF